MAAATRPRTGLGRRRAGDRPLLTATVYYDKLDAPSLRVMTSDRFGSGEELETFRVVTSEKPSKP